MNITVKAGNTEFTLYGIDFVPQQGDTLIKDEKVYTVEKRVMLIAKVILRIS